LNSYKGYWPHVILYSVLKNQTSVFGDWTGFIVLHLLGNYLGREGLGWWNYQFTGCLLTYKQNNYWHFIVL